MKSADLSRHPNNPRLKTLEESIRRGRIVAVHVRRLREKVEPDPAEPRHVCTVWGVGYRLG